MLPPPNPPLLPALLEAHHHGRPPFLIRNLRYVRAEKARATSRIWDMTWASSTSPYPSYPRHIILTLRPSRCLFHPPILRRIDGAQQANIRLSLRIKQTDDHIISFAIRESPMRAWPSQDTQPGDSFEDVPVAEVFDLTAALPLLSASPAALIVCVDVRVNDTAARGEVVVWEGANGHFGEAVPNAVVTVPLFSEQATIRKMATKVSLADEVRKEFTKDNNIQEEEDVVMKKEDPIGSVKLELHGGVQREIENVITSDESLRVHVTCTYSCPKMPGWPGITRHDFVCPWCHRNCHRFRALLWHFHVEHDDMGFNVQGSKPDNGRRDLMENMEGMPFLLKFQITPESFSERGRGNVVRAGRENVGPKTVRRGEVEQVEELHLERGRFRGMKNLMVKNSADKISNVVSAISLDDPEKDESDTDSDASDGVSERQSRRQKEFLAVVKQELFGKCKNCLRKHDGLYSINKKFCGEHCEMVYKDKMAEKDGNGSSSNQLPLSAYVSKQREKTIDFKKAFGHLKLYHVVSLSEVKEEHFNEEDPDSEEEVDQSWRLELSLERIRHLEDATPKEKILWMMWNKFAHDHYPIPSVYGERYTRYTLELFALEYGPQVAELKLRLQFVGFLRALHIHGLIDTIAIKSIMKCLDGKKKLRECKISSRPDLPDDLHNRTPRGTGAGRGRNRRRRNNVTS